MNKTWLIIRHVHYESSSFTDDYSVPKFTKNKGIADQYLHSLNMLNEKKDTSYFIVEEPNDSK